MMDTALGVVSVRLISTSALSSGVYFGLVDETVHLSTTNNEVTNSCLGLKKCPTCPSGGGSQIFGVGSAESLGGYGDTDWTPFLYFGGQKE